MGPVLPQPPLGNETDQEVAEDGRIDADKQPAHIPEDDGEVDVAENSPFGQAVCEVEGEWDYEAEQVRYRDPLVSASDGEHVFGHSPCDG